MKRSRILWLTVKCRNFIQAHLLLMQTYTREKHLRLFVWDERARACQRARNESLVNIVDVLLLLALGIYHRSFAARIVIRRYK